MAIIQRKESANNLTNIHVSDKNVRIIRIPQTCKRVVLANQRQITIDGKLKTFIPACACTCHLDGTQCIITNNNTLITLNFK